MSGFRTVRQDGCTCGSAGPDDGSHLPGCPVRLFRDPREPIPEQPATLLRDTEADRERLVKRLPQILAETDEAGSDADDWAGSEYVERFADAILAALRGSDGGEA